MSEIIKQEKKLTGKLGNTLIYVDPDLEDRSIEITKNGMYTITANEGYDALNTVEINATVENKPDKGFYIKETDAEGYPTVVELIGYEEVPTLAFSYRVDSNNISGFYKKLHTVILSEGTKSIGQQAFYHNDLITSIIVPDSLEEIKTMGLFDCSSLELKTLPNVTTIGNYCFQYCPIVQLSMPKLESVVKNFGYGYTPFGYCTQLKAIWIGENFKGIDDYMFTKNTALRKIFINLPRATAELLPGFSFNWEYYKTSTGLVEVVCNDDEGWMSLEEFDATDW